MKEIFFICPDDDDDSSLPDQFRLCIMTDATSLRKRLGPLIDQITQDIQTIETTKNLQSKYRIECSLTDATSFANDLERLDPAYGRDFKQRIEALRRRLENVSRVPVHGAWNSGFDGEADRLGQEQRDLLLRGHASLLRTDQALQTSRTTAHETEQLGTEIMAELATQRGALLRTQDKLNEGGENLRMGNKTLRVMYHRVIMNKVLLITIILVELAILGGVIYWKFFSKK